MNLNKVAFLIAGTDISGGMNVIFNHALYLTKHNIEVTFISVKKLNRNHNWHEIFAKHNIEWRVINESQHETYDVVIATFWATYYHLWEVNAARYAYFVQSIESRFVPEYDNAYRLFIEATYDLQVPVITEAVWIKKYLEELRGSTVYLAPNGLNKDIYNIEGPVIEKRNAKKLRLLVEGPIEASFKNVERTIQLCRQVKNVEIWLLTSSECTEYSGVDKVFSRVPIAKTAEIYRSCDVIVKLSYVEGMFGPPLEMFGCGGTAIVYNVTGHDEYIKHGFNALVAKVDDESQVIKYINDLKNKDLLAYLKQNAIQTAGEWIGWEQSSKIFHESLVKSLDHNIIDKNLLKAYSKRMNGILGLLQMSKIQFNLNEDINWDQDIPNIHWAYRITMIKRKLQKYPFIMKIVGIMLRLAKSIGRKI